MTLSFKKATKTQSRARIALVGPSGSGKTYTALSFARHLGARVALIDTERGSASKYADEFQFDVLELEEFSPLNYVEAIGAAVREGFDVLVIDSLSHAWSGAGGALELVDRAAKKAQSGNSFGAWREVTPLHNKLVDSILRADCHVIVTMRAKTEYVQEKDERGRTQIRKVGLAPVQRDGLEYEFDIVADIDADHNFIVSKTRCKALTGTVENCAGEAVALKIKSWLTSGEPESEEVQKKRLIAQVREVLSELNAKGYQPQWTKATLELYVGEMFLGAPGLDALSVEELTRLQRDLNSKLDTQIAENEAERSLAGGRGRNVIDRAGAQEGAAS